MFAKINKSKSKEYWFKYKKCNIASNIEQICNYQFENAVKKSNQNRHCVEYKIL